MDMLPFSTFTTLYLWQWQSNEGAAFSPLMLLNYCNIQLSLSIFIKCTMNREVLTPISPARPYKIR